MSEIPVRLHYHARLRDKPHPGDSMTDSSLDTELTKKVIESLNRILELELAGVVRYMHYSFMIFGHNRIPIVAWLRDQSNESNAHAVLAGEHITAFGGHPSLAIGSLLETHKHDVNEILNEAYKHEKEGLDEYHVLLGLVAGKSVLLEEYARDQIAAEEMHLADIRKMMRKPGSL
jgi:bacterioferritin